MKQCNCNAWNSFKKDWIATCGLDDPAIRSSEKTTNGLKNVISHCPWCGKELVDKEAELRDEIIKEFFQDTRRLSHTVALDNLLNKYNITKKE